MEKVKGRKQQPRPDSNYSDVSNTAHVPKNKYNRAKEERQWHDEWETDERIDTIGLNGNDGLHYNEEK